MSGEEQKKKKEEMNKIEIFNFDFLNLVKGLWNF